jgi:hypothetical protein
MSLRVTGSIAGVSFTRPAGLSSMEVLPDSRLTTGYPPSYPAFSSQMVRTSTQRLASTDICSSALGNLDTNGSSTSTCLGYW